MKNIVKKVINGDENCVEDAFDKAVLFEKNQSPIGLIAQSDLKSLDLWDAASFADTNPDVKGFTMRISRVL